MSRLRDRRVRHDRFYKKAKKENYASRAVYKLQEIDRRFQIIGRSQRVLDLGCAPGSWLEYAAQRVGPRGRVIGIDLLPVERALPEQVTVLEGDIYDTPQETLRQGLKAFDVVLSDMAPDTSGIRFTDVTRSIQLVETALELASTIGATDGNLVAKVFVGTGFDELHLAIKKRYRKVKMVKPEGSRKESMEQYIVGLELK